MLVSLSTGKSLMSAKYFLDTNILVYSFNKDEHAKQDKAIELIDQAMKEETIVLAIT